MLGAHDTYRTLKATVEAVSPQFRPYVGELLRQLEEAVDAYAMALELLLVPLSFELQDDGRREVPAGLLAACEKRRQRVKALACRLGDPAQIPVLEEALRFQELESFAEKKAMIHRFEGWLARQANGSSGAWRFARCCDDEATNSKWDFDRISFYLSRERGEDPPSLDDALDWLRKEFEKTRADCDASHMPLTYCLGPLSRALKGAGSDAGEVLGEAGRAQLAEAQALLGMIAALGSAREKQRDYPEPSRLRVEAESCLALLAELRTR
ncbi:MAG: hypothetical protein KDH20_00980 [Rhodocyclaceae bacterium]|nr:hypothetical protein [Rhodocyclaceae bacterium]